MKWISQHIFYLCLSFFLWLFIRTAPVFSMPLIILSIVACCKPPNGCDGVGFCCAPTPSSLEPFWASPSVISMLLVCFSELERKVEKKEKRWKLVKLESVFYVYALSEFLMEERDLWDFARAREKQNESLNWKLSHGGFSSFSWTLFICFSENLSNFSHKKLAQTTAVCRRRGEIFESFWRHRSASAEWSRPNSHIFPKNKRFIVTLTQSLLCVSRKFNDSRRRWRHFFSLKSNSVANFSSRLFEFLLVLRSNQNPIILVTCIFTWNNIRSPNSFCLRIKSFFDSMSISRLVCYLRNIVR